MRKLFSLGLIVLFVLCSSSSAFATAVTASRANDANDLTAGAVFDNGGAWVLTVSDAADFTTGVITTAGNGGASAGTATFAGTTTINTAASTNVIGTGTNALLAINGGIASKTLTVAGNAFATTTNVTGTGTIAFNGNFTGNVNYNNGATGLVTLATSKTITGNVAAATAGEGTLTLGSGSTVTGNVGATRLGTLNATAGNATITGTVGATNVNLSGNTLTEGGNLTLPASATVSLTANSGTSYGNMAITGSVTNNAATTFAVTVSGYVPNGATLNVLNASAGAPTTVTTAPTSTSPNVSFATSVSGNDVILTATRANTGTTGNNSAVGTTINSIGTPSGDMSVVLGALDSLTSTSSINSALDQLDPSSNNGTTTQASFNVTNETVGVLTNHIGEANAAPSGPGSGVSTGDFWTDNGIWVKGFGNSTEQDNHKGVTGYDADMWGVMGGMDGKVAENLRLGFAGGYAATSVDGKINTGQADVDSAIGTVYLGYDDPSPWYGSMGFTFTWNFYNSDRPIQFGSVNRTAKSDYDGQAYTGFWDVGYVFSESGWEITPMASLNYTHLEIGSYTETNAGALSLNVASQGYDKVQSGLGMKVAYPMQEESGKWVPEAHFKWLYDFVGDKAGSTSTFTGGGVAFESVGLDPEQSTYNFGGGVTFYSKGNISVTGVYDFEFANDYTSHTGQGVVRYTF